MGPLHSLLARALEGAPAAAPPMDTSHMTRPGLRRLSIRATP